MRNGYFRLVELEQGFGVQLIPPEDGGAKIMIAEVVDYLEKNNLVYDLSVLKEKIDAGVKDTVFLGTGPCPMISESYKLNISEDKMTAILRFYPPSGKSFKLLSVEEMVRDLRFREITFGIQTENLQHFFAAREYCKDIIAAKGKEIVYGKDAKIDYYFNTDIHARPTVREDGSVDFFNLNAINNCTENMLLAQITPEIKGESGRNVKGEVLEAPAVKAAYFRYNRNCETSEDKLQLFAKVNGHVTLVDGMVFVSDVYEVEDVDNSTGNIDYEGSVQINGNVLSNFTVRAKGNVIVSGVVEGATIVADGNIIITRGMNGMNKGVLSAGGNIIAKFLENSTVEADGYVQTESILHSNVRAGKYVEVNGKRGFITGGHVAATESLTVKTLGSTMGATTIVEVGADPKAKEEYQKTQKDIAELQKIIRSTQTILSSYAQKRAKGMTLNKEQLEYIKQLALLTETKKKELDACTEKIEKLQSDMEVQSQAYVKVTDQAYVGTKIIIGDLSMVVQSNTSYCKFEKVRGNIKAVPI